MCVSKQDPIDSSDLVSTKNLLLLYEAPIAIMHSKRKYDKRSRKIGGDIRAADLSCSCLGDRQNSMVQPSRTGGQLGGGFGWRVGGARWARRRWIRPCAFPILVGGVRQELPVLVTKTSVPYGLRPENEEGV